MHYVALVLIPADGDVDTRVAEAMHPYDENREIEKATDEDGEVYWTNPVSFWDWWQVGGRWTGLLSGYDPDADPALTERCWLCHGTGRRDDEVGRRARERNPAYGCNGCNGKGRSRMWPTEWPRRDDDVMPAAAALAALRDDPEKAPSTFVVHDSEHVAEDVGGMVALIERTIVARHAAGHDGDRIVVVDYHC
ncbi:MAG TPA: hypothetical protein VGH76_15260 [Actinomycetospora sp.]|jgi:hypothetical protein|uniref:hypothetical protein n=1 Tax=Actinomycetospora sp. TaxID=1872135 RepID=UPI002F41992C